ncbi:stomatin/prohibitin-family membrane protease subunit [Ahniella affigens]|uniref:Stomatin/prohibitin-family membrane protease subunit n=2 Tax=Ahniella affigens TaxID=2021234 RepID=A0A2P1PY63_9GAMM|nr:stomatin/prohibitin-family membrane protease subunit [Ahniella affigens]
MLPGTHWLWTFQKDVRIEVLNLGVGEFNLAQADTLYLANRGLLAPVIEQVDIGNQELGLVYREGRLFAVLPPGARRYYWRAPWQFEVKRQSIADDFRIPADLIALLIQPQHAKLLAEVTSNLILKEVPEHHLGLLLVNGKVETPLNPGLYGFWKLGRMLAIETIDLRSLALDVQGQEILSRDKVSLRVNLAAEVRVQDPMLMRRQATDWKDAVYRTLQFGLREAVGTRTLDQMLGNKGELDGAIRAYAEPRLASIGVGLVNAGIKDVILPGEMKVLLNQVVEAEKQAQANVIKRREETAATRNLLNTARMLEENPVLMRLKELEALEKVTEKIGQLTVFGGLDGVMKQLVSLRA